MLDFCENFHKAENPNKLKNLFEIDSTHLNKNEVPG